jgi:hypothetical protein
MRWARFALSTLALSIGMFGGAGIASASDRAVSSGPALTLSSQTPWVTPTAPWFTLALGVGDGAVSASDLHVSLTVYSRIVDDSELQQAIAATPQQTPLAHVTDVPVTGGTGGRVATTCLTVLPESSSTAPTPAPGDSTACPAGGPTVYLDCTPGTGRCGDVYPVSVALLRKGSTSPVARFTTFLTYQESVSTGVGGALRVGLIAPVRGGTAGLMAATLSAHRDIPVTLDIGPSTVSSLLTRGSTNKTDRTTLDTLGDLSGDEVLGQPYVPIDLPVLTASGLAGEIAIQLERGSQLLHQAGLRPTASTWVDTASAFTSGESDQLSTGLLAAHADHLVLSDSDLAAGGRANYTFAQPFTLDVGRTSHVTAAAANSTLSALFSARTHDPTLAANQLLASLSFVHFENASLPDKRGVVIQPPAGWRASSPFMDTLLVGLTKNPVLSPVTLNQFFAQVPVGGNEEPAVRKLGSGSASGSGSGGSGSGGSGPINKNLANKILLARQHLTSFTGATPTPHPAALTTMSDAILATESSDLSSAQRSASVAAYDKRFTALLGQISLATERTVTFTSRKAPIPISVLSSAPYAVKVVVSLNSDKFTFPNGSTRTLTLDRPTTSFRLQAQARTSGDRLPIDITLRTPDGQLVIAHTELSVHSTSISIVGVGLTVLAGLVLLVWWGRTWRRSRRQRPRAH